MQRFQFSASSYYADPTANATWVSYLPPAGAVYLALAFLTFVLTAELERGVVIVIGFWLACAGAVAYLIVRNAPKFVDFPKLAAVATRSQGKKQ